ncbi:MAG: cytochrome c [Planctomycetes bacterium]|nr:cytochrome c [Planctomycetota bacterium]
MNNKLTVLAAILGALACSWAVASFLARDNSQRNRELFTEMAYSPAAEAQMQNEQLPGGMVQQSPPEGTLHVAQYHYAAPAKPYNDLIGNDLEFVNRNTSPFAGLDAEKRALRLAEGTTLFVNQCQSCHGAGGGGGAPVAAFGIGATNLPANVGKYSDGALFHIITYGVRTMPAHGDHLRAEDRWKIILYLRKIAEGQP